MNSYSDVDSDEQQQYNTTSFTYNKQYKRDRYMSNSRVKYESYKNSWRQLRDTQTIKLQNEVKKEIQQQSVKTPPKLKKQKFQEIYENAKSSSFNKSLSNQKHTSKKTDSNNIFTDYFNYKQQDVQSLDIDQIQSDLQQLRKHKIEQQKIVKQIIQLQPQPVNDRFFDLQQKYLQQLPSGNDYNVLDNFKQSNNRGRQLIKINYQDNNLNNKTIYDKDNTYINDLSPAYYSQKSKISRFGKITYTNCKFRRLGYIKND